MNPHKLILNDVGEGSTLTGNIPVVGEYIGKASFMDLIYAIFLPMIATSALVNNLPESIAQYDIFIIIGAAGIGALILIAIPEYTTLSGLLKLYRDHKRQPKERRLLTDGGDSDDKIDRRSWEMEGDTIEVTGVERLISARHGGQDVGFVERDDGDVVGVIKVDQGVNLDTGTDGQVSRSVESFASFLNHSLDFPVQFHLTNRKFNPDNYLEKYEERLNDEEVIDNPVLQTYIEQYTKKSRQFYDTTLIREYYVVIPVSKSDVRQREPDSGLLNVSAMPGIGPVLSELLGASDQRNLHEDYIVDRQVKEVNNRMDKFVNAGIQGLNGASASKLDVDECATLLKRFWEGRDMGHREGDSLVRSHPVVKGEPDEAAAQGDA